MKKVIDGNVYEVEMLPTDDFGLFKNGNLEKPFCSRREAESYLLSLCQDEGEKEGNKA